MDLMNLVARITLDSSEYTSGLKGLAGKAGKTIGTIAKVGGAAIAAGGAAVVAVTKQAIDSYAEYEQLTGGIETLYGENSKAAEDMMQHASEAWKTAGMSANEYMETAIASSAALISSLGGDTEEAARLMDMSIIDMSDNVNKMGTTMESVQNAYRGFSRGNFTMLDNLALGFAGTKEGMQELLDKAEEISGVHFDIDSYADIVQAIHVVQENMGIAGTTSKEASETISGSINAMKSAWTNLLTGLADGSADIGKLIDDLVISIVGENGKGGVINNIMPAIERALDGIIKLITTAAPTFIPMAVDLIIEHLPEIIEAGTQILVALITGLVQAIPQLVAALPQIFTAIKTAFSENWPALKEAGAQLLTMIGEGIISALGWLDEKLAEVGAAISTELDEAWQTITQTASETWEGIKKTLSDAWEGIKKDAGDVWDGIIKTVTEKIDTGKKNIGDTFEGIRTTLSGIIEKIKGLFNFSWSFPKPKMPHFKVDWNTISVFGKEIGAIPSVSIEWYKKAYDNPYMFTKPTVMGFGDGVGGEMVYGHQSLMNDIKTAMQSVFSDFGDQTIVVQSILDGKVIGESVTKYQRQKARAYG